MVHRALLERPFIAVGHDEQHRFTTTGRYQRFQRIYRIALILPGTFIAVDTVDEIESGKTTITFYL